MKRADCSNNNHLVIFCSERFARFAWDRLCQSYLFTMQKSHKHHDHYWKLKRSDFKFDLTIQTTDRQPGLKTLKHVKAVFDPKCIMASNFSTGIYTYLRVNNEFEAGL